MINLEYIMNYDTDDEDKYVKKMDKENFFKIISNYKIDLDIVKQKDKLYNEDFHRFNLIISDLCEKNKLSIVDCASFLYTDYFSETDVLNCFNDENNYLLRKTLANKYGVHLQENSMKWFIF